jgi:riboflavin kinase / FMN adenylyltransferase
MPFEVLRSAEEWTARFGQPRRPSVVTIGNFDGVHRGHQEILRGVRELAAQAGRLPAVLTFFPHPVRVLRPAQAPSLLMTLEQRLAAIHELGIEAVLVLHFDTELANVSPEDFVRRFLLETMHARAVLVGANFRFGHRQAGDTKLLGELGASRGFEVRVVPPVIEDGATVSSTAVRRALRDGRVEQARQMLGRPFSLEGEIGPGTGQGRKLVVPTLNLTTPQETLPKTGVYATEAIVQGKSYRAATNVGMRPTFDGTRMAIESHLLDFSDSLTSGKMEVRFWARLRDERKFPGPEALREQVLRDIEQAREYFRGSRLDTRNS